MLLPGTKRGRKHELDDGEVLRFKSRPKSDEEMQASIPAWLERMGCTGQVQMVPYGKVMGIANMPSVEAWSLQGQVTVVDADRFMHAWAYGIGRLRTYGFGMIREKKV